MFRTCRTLLVLSFVLGLVGLGVWYALAQGTGSVSAGPVVAPPGQDKGEPVEALDKRFATQVKPVLERNCFACHRTDKKEAELDLRRLVAETADKGSKSRHWEHVFEKLQAREMPPEDAPRKPTDAERAAVIAWIRDLRDLEIRQNAGDPGPVLARRLSNAEFDNTIRDLTGVDIRPTREFPIDPANEAGFDNSGESLAMSPALLNKYLAAARLVAHHVVLEPDGFVFASHPVVTDTDRDKYCVRRIVDFYERHNVDLADYFLAAWKYRHRQRLGRPDVDLNQLAAEAGLSPLYLELVWSALTENKADAGVGPLAVVRTVWGELPAPDPAAVDAALPGCRRLRDLVVKMRRQLPPHVDRLHGKSMSDGSQPLVLWHNRQLAARHRSYAGEVEPDLRKLAEQFKGADAALARLVVRPEGADADKRARAALERFCDVFPDAFVVIDRGPYFDPNGAGQGRLLTAGFHLMQGYFRDDEPLHALILSERERQELNALWQELHFVAQDHQRQYKDFVFFERAEPPRFMGEAAFDFARSEDRDVTSEAKVQQLATAYRDKARKQGSSAEVLAAIDDYFTRIAAEMRAVERSRLAAEPSHLEALVRFAERAYRRPLSPAEGADLRAFYATLRKEHELGHEEALRDTLVSVLLSPHFCYRFERTPPGPRAVPLGDYALASRLSYFLWSSMPDAELLKHAAVGDLHEPAVLKAQTRRLLRDPKVRGLATEFGGNWLDFRRFEEHNSVDRVRFPAFTNELRSAMFEEPVRYLVDVAQRDRSVLDLLYGNDTFVNPVLAKHYGMPDSRGKPDEWVHVEDAGQYGRGGVLPMAVFQTRNAPGLRTSPVKRGYWVVRRLLGEQIPPPPPTVPELPKDEARTGELTLPQLLARHRDNKSCAACHRRFDSIGLVFENFGPVGELRTRDLGGRPIDTAATFPDGIDRKGLAGLRAYLQEKRQDDYLDNLCRKMFVYALGRSLVPSDDLAIKEMRTRLVADDYKFGSLVETVVLSPQFLNRRGRDVPRAQ